MRFFTIFSLVLIVSAASAESISKDKANEQIKRALVEWRSQERPEDLAAGLPAPLTPLSGALDLGEHRMPFSLVVRGDPGSRLPLFICLHGGGQDTKQPGAHTWAVNTLEFQTQTKLATHIYQPDGIYFIPRMADDRLGRWWHKHNQTAFDRVIDHAITRWNADPDRVYLMGISEGGYGTVILAPFMADRFAGANAMAAGVGLANPPANLRNLSFRSDVGEKDLTFDRRQLAEAFHKELDRLHSLDPAAYIHTLNIQPGRGHGIDYSQGVKWIARHTRDPWPEKIVWVNQSLDGVRRTRFHWLKLSPDPGSGVLRIDARADRADNSITLSIATLARDNTDGNRTHGKENVAEAPRSPRSGARITLLFSDLLLDLDRPVTITCNGSRVFRGIIARSATTIRQEFAARPDPASCPTAMLEITSPPAVFQEEENRRKDD